MKQERQNSFSKFKLVDENVCKGKHITGTYFEIALNNFIRTTEYIFTKAGVGKVVGKLQDNYSMAENIQKVIKSKISPTQQSNLSRLIFKHMPFFGALMADEVDNSLYPIKKEIKELEKKRKELTKSLKDKQCTNKTEISKEISGLDKKIVASKNALERQIVGSSSIAQIKYLVTISRAMVSLRNFYSHKNPYSNTTDLALQKEDETKLACWLETIFKGERGILLERKNHSQEDTKFLTQDGKLNYNINKNKKSTRNNNFYFGPGWKSENGWSLTDFGRYFFCSLFLRKADADQFAKDVRLYADSPFKLTTDERIRLQLIENQRAEAEQKRIEENGEKRKVNPRIIGDTESVQNNIIREMLDMHRIRIPREKRIDADQTEGILVMDILNELRKCPKVVHDTLNPSDKASFVTKGLSPNGDIVENKLIRHQDRFASLALRCIDEEGYFPDIRFHLRLGLFRYRFYPKTTIDGSPVEPVRAVHKEVNGFGRWRDAERLRISTYQRNFQERIISDDGLEQPVPDAENTPPYITDWRATYNIHANRIGLAWGLPQMKDGFYLPALDVDDGNNKNRKAKLDMPAPLCYLSTYDLPALLFYIHIHKLYHGSKYAKEGIKDAETIIKEKYNAIHDFFNDISSGKLTKDDILNKQKELMLADSEIPVKLRCFFGTKVLYKKNGKPVTKKLETGERILVMKDWRPGDERKKHAIATLKKIIEEDDKRLEAFERKRDKIIAGGRNNRYGRKGHADVRHGSIARYIAKSMLKWQPAQAVAGGDKLTSPNFRALADFLADYGVGEEYSIDKLQAVLEKSKLVGGVHPHPFLEKDVLGKTPYNIEQLYTVYLKAEKEYATALVAGLEQNKADVCIPPFARPKGLRWDTSIEEAAERYLKVHSTPFDETNTTHDTPIMLPDGMFTPHILKLLRLVQSDDSNKEKGALASLNKLFEKKTDDLGASYVIRFWFDQVEGDASQAFYNNGSKQYLRFHRTISLLDPKRKPNRQLIPDYLSEDEIAEKLKLARKRNKGVLKSKMIKAHGFDSSQDAEANEKVVQMTDMLKEVAEKERQIRRYRVQDIALFLIVRDMLTEILSKSGDNKKENIRKQTLERINKMHLRDFGYNFDFNLFVSSDGKSSYSYTHKSGIEITMPSLSLNNYGNIFRILTEGQRLDSLLTGLKELGIKKVSFGQLTGEFAQHNQKRSNLLGLAFQIEQDVYDQNETILSDHTQNGFYNKTIKKDDKGMIINPSTDAKRNHFKDLIELNSQFAQIVYLKLEIDNKDGKETKTITLQDFLKELRNAVAHNRYPNSYVFKKLKEQTSNAGRIINVQNIIGLIEKSARDNVDFIKKTK